MFKRFFLAVLAVLVINVSSSFASSFRSGTPAQLVFYLLKAFDRYQGLDDARAFLHDPIGKATSPSDTFISFREGSNAAQIFYEVTEDFRGQNYTFERVANRLWEELEERDYDVAGFQAYIWEEARGLMEEGYELQNLINLGVDLNEEVLYETRAVFPIYGDSPDYLDNARADRERSMADVIHGWAIEQYLKGGQWSDPVHTIEDAADYMVPGLSSYLGGFDASDPDHVISLFYYANLGQLIESESPQNLVRYGYGSLLGMIEAYKNEVLFKTDAKGNVTRGSSGTIEGIDSSEFIGLLLSAKTEILEALNNEKYYGAGKTLNPAESSYDDGVVSGWLEQIFAKLREENYDSQTKEFRTNPRISFEQAQNYVVDSITYGKEVAIILRDAGFGDLPLYPRDKTFKEEAKVVQARDLVAKWTDLALRLKDKEVISSIDEIKTFMPDSATGGELLGKLVELFDKAGVRSASGKKRDADYFKTDPEGMAAYAGFVGMAVDFVTYPEYYGLNINSAEEAADALIKMVDLGLDNGLPSMLMDTLDIERLEIGEGYMAGEYFFWNQVFYAAKNNVGFDKALGFVEAHLDERGKIREELQGKMIAGSMYIEQNIQILNAFASALPIAQSELLGSGVLNYIKDEVSLLNFYDILGQGAIRERFPESEIGFKPKSPDEDSEWKWSNIIDSTTGFDFEDESNTGYAIELPTSIDPYLM